MSGTSFALFAITALGVTPVTAQVTPPAASQDAAGQADRGTAADIVVTAQRRDEALLEVPISISVLSGERLDSSSSEGVIEALRSVPGVTTSEYFQSGGSGISVRGVTANAPTLNGSNPVSYYLDGVPFSFVKSAIAPDSSAYDLERVEILRGPQGTLYGASALNGVVRVLTKNADLTKTDFKGRVSASYTQDGGINYRTDGMVNVPLVEDKLGLRLVAGYVDNEGWIDRPGKDDANNVRNFSLRAKVGFQASEALRIDLSYWRARNRSGGLSVGSEDFFRDTRIPEPQSFDYDSLGLNIEYDFGGVVLTNSTGYLDLVNDGIYDYAGTAFGIALGSIFSTEIFSNELTLNSDSSGPLSWSIGGSYRRARDKLEQYADPASFTYTAFDNSDAYAVFGEATYEIGQIRLTGGLRYFYDDVSARASDPPTPTAEENYDAVTPRAVITWLPSDRATVYASYSQGFRSGSIQYQGLVPPEFPGVRPDRLHNYEVGTKMGLLDNHIQFEAAAYFIDWKNVQQSLSVPAINIPNAFVTALVNAASASGVGVDAKISAQVTPGLTLSVAGSYNDLRVDEAVESSGIVLFQAGERLNRSPSTTIVGTADYAFMIGDSNANLSGSLNYTSPQSDRGISGTTTLVARGQSQLVGGARFSVDMTERLRATLFVDNITNQNPRIIGSATIPTNDFDLRIRPRTFGLQFEIR
jgi:outer membrane receptor protein involved in Fe transport